MESERPTRQEVIDTTAQTAAAMRPQRVPVNAYETTGALVIVAPLPAVTADDVTIELGEDKVRFWADLRSSGPRQFLINEWEYGGYEREIDLPAGFGSNVEATLSNGQLAIRVLRGDAPGDKIQIKPSTGS